MNVASFVDVWPSSPHIPSSSTTPPVSEQREQREQQSREHREKQDAQHEQQVREQRAQQLRKLEVQQQQLYQNQEVLRASMSSRYPYQQQQQRHPPYRMVVPGTPPPHHARLRYSHPYPRLKSEAGGPFPWAELMLCVLILIAIFVGVSSILKQSRVSAEVKQLNAHMTQITTVLLARR